jgi:hypothetical protein
VHEEKKSFECDICSATFAQRAALDIHISFSLVHEGKKQFKCNDCHISFGQKGRMKSNTSAVHEKTHSNVTFVVLLFHMKVYSASFHDGKKPLKCDSSAFSKDLNWRHIPPMFMKEISHVEKEDI